MGIRINVLVLFILISGSSWAQGTTGAFNEAKRLFAVADYRSATLAFDELTEDPVYGAYAQYFKGLSEYRSDRPERAIFTWKNLLLNDPRWEGTSQVLYWLAFASFESGQLEEGLSYVDSYGEQTTSRDASSRMIPVYLAESSTDELTDYYQKYPDNEEIALLLARALVRESTARRNSGLLDSLVKRFAIPISSLANRKLVNEHKERYAIALALPFMFESLDNPNTVIRNKLIADLYQGMLLAQMDLADKGIQLDLYCYDTRKDSAVTSSLLPDLITADLIVGPLYPKPIQVIQDFSFASGINMISPITSNGSYVGSNPFAFLFKPSYETMAEELAAYVATQHSNRNALIYFSPNERDSLFAATYRAGIELDSFQIGDFRSLDELEAKMLLDTLIHTYEEIYTKEVADSIGEIEGRFVKYRRLRSEEETWNQEAEYDSLRIPFFYEEELEEDFERSMIDRENSQKMVAYEMRLKVPKDSIGHIMIASRSNTIINNLVSAIAAREDSAGLYGYGNWFDFKVLNYGLYDQLDIKVAYPEFMDKRKDRYQLLQTRFARTYGTPPSEFHFQGYEFLFFVGTNLDRYGKYFQNGFSQNGYQPGQLFEGVLYPSTNDNQVVPIVTLEHFEIKPVNRSSYTRYGRSDQ